MKALDAGGRVRALSIAAVHYRTGDVHPLGELADVLHAHDAILVVDASQAAGAMAMDARQRSRCTRGERLQVVVRPVRHGILGCAPSCATR